MPITLYMTKMMYNLLKDAYCLGVWKDDWKALEARDEAELASGARARC